MAPMVSRKRLGELLLEAGVIDGTQLKAALGHQRQWGCRLGQALVDLRLASEADVVTSLARQSGFEVARLDGLEPYALGQALALVPREVAVTRNLLPLAADTSTLTVAMSDPGNLAVVDELQFRTGRRVRVCLGGDREISEAVRRHYPDANEVHAIALDLDDADADAALAIFDDPIGGGSRDALEAFFAQGPDASAPARAAPQPAPRATDAGRPPPPAAPAGASRPAARPPSPSSGPSPLGPQPGARAPSPAAARAPAEHRPPAAGRAPLPSGVSPGIGPAGVRPTAAPSTLGSAWGAPPSAPPRANPRTTPAGPAGAGVARPGAAAEPSRSAPAPARSPPATASSARTGAPASALAAGASPRRALPAGLQRSVALPGEIPRGGSGGDGAELDPPPELEPLRADADDLAPVASRAAPAHPGGTRGIAQGASHASLLDALARMAAGEHVDPALLAPERVAAVLLELMLEKGLVTQAELLDRLRDRTDDLS
jgi:type IV pilus assembly protein PilB